MNSFPSVFPEVALQHFPLLTPEEMTEVDRIMEEDIGISLFQMMENAGSNLAHFVHSQFGRDARVCVMAGKGNNGGGGMVAARHLANWGHEVVVVVAMPGHYFKDVPIHQLRILHNMDMPIVAGWEKDNYPRIRQNFREATVIIDALLGYSLVGKPQDTYADLIQMANSAETTIIALDTPSGLDLASGRCLEPTTRATITFTLAAPKVGLVTAASKQVSGDIFVADISIPEILWKRLHIEVPRLFTDSPIVKLKI